MKWADEITTDDTLYAAKYINFVVRTLAGSTRRLRAELDTIKKWSQAQHDADGEALKKAEAELVEEKRKHEIDWKQCEDARDMVLEQKRRAEKAEALVAAPSSEARPCLCSLPEQNGHYMVECPHYKGVCQKHSASNCGECDYDPEAKWNKTMSAHDKCYAGMRSRIKSFEDEVARLKEQSNAHRDAQMKAEAERDDALSHKAVWDNHFKQMAKDRDEARVEALEAATVTEAAPGGLSEEARKAMVVVETLRHLQYPGGEERAKLVHAALVLADELTARPTPAPNREAELKVIEALLRECVKITAHIPKGTEPHGQSMDTSIRMNDFRKFRIAVANALASLAQSEMKGSAGKESK